MNNNYHNNRNNQPYNQRNNYNHYDNQQRYHPQRRGMPTWAIILLSIVGTAVASIGAFSYFNKPSEQTNNYQPNQQQIDNTITQPNNRQQAGTKTIPTVEMVQILSSAANYETVTKPVKSCHMVNKEVTMANPDKNNGTTGALIGAGTGAVAGGIIGNQVKNGKGTIIGGLIGAAAGAVTGNEIEKAKQPATITKQEQVQECDIENKSVKHIVNYTTTYSSQGVTKTATTKKPYKTGTSVALNKLH